MDELDYYEDNSTNCLNISDSVIKSFQTFRIFCIIGIPLLLVPSSILQLFFIYRYKSTFLHRQFLYTTVVLILMNAIYIVQLSTVIDVGCSLSFAFVTNGLIRYIFYVDIIQVTIIHLLLLYKLCKHIETRNTQRLQALCCDIRPRLWHEVMIVCIQLGLPLPVLIVNLVVTLKTLYSILKDIIDSEMTYFFLPTLAVNILLGLIYIVLLVVWFCMLIKRKLLKNKAKFVCTQISHILIVLVVLLIGNTAFFYNLDDSFFTFFTLRTFATVSFSVYFLVSLPSL